jgi:hypothetical protein
MLLPADVTFRREEVSELLQLSPGVIDALAASGVVGRDVIAAADLERLFRDSLLRLYQAQAMRAAATTPTVADAVARENPADDIEIEIESVNPESSVVRTFEEPIVVEGERPDLRAGLRYIPRRQIGGLFRDVKFVMLQLSSSGLRIRHEEALRAGDEARLSFAILNPARTFVMRARVVWTSIGQQGDGRSHYVSGLRVIENVDRLVNAAYLLRTARELRIDERPSSRGNAKNVPRFVSGLADEDVVAIIQAVRKLASDPEEAARWYARARFAIADEDVRKAAPRGAREREEVVGVWEYLRRQQDLRTVAGVMQWIRSSQVASV